MTPIFTSGPSRTASLTDLDDRARDIFRRIVESYLETGDPVGSRTLSKGGVQLSPASIRNTMQDLALAGPARLAAHQRRADADPRRAAAVRRRPAGGRRRRRGRAARDRRPPVGPRPQLRRRPERGQLDPVGPGRRGGDGGQPGRATPASSMSSSSRSAPTSALAVMVFEDGQVENRLMRLSPGVTPSALQEASNFLASRLKGRTLIQAQAEIRTELDRRPHRAGPDRRPAGRGRSGGLERRRGRRPGADRARPGQPAERPAAAGDLAKVQRLFDDLEQKEQLIGLLDGVS
jgi:heat-inducible transcriptional repressor